MSDKTHHGSKKRRLIGVLEFAEKLNVHPASIPRMIKSTPNFPQPGKVAHKNAWYEDVADAYVGGLMQKSERAA
jgi:predicted DNA-binding transcriptional regulator AlpA